MAEHPDEVRARELYAKWSAFGAIAEKGARRLYKNAILEAIRTERANGDARVLAEREACAKEADRIAGNTHDFDAPYRRAAGQIAAAIRARDKW